MQIHYVFMQIVQHSTTVKTLFATVSLVSLADFLSRDQS